MMMGKNEGQENQKISLTDGPSSVVFGDQVPSCKEILFELFNAVRFRVATRDARDDNFSFFDTTVHGVLG